MKKFLIGCFAIVVVLAVGGGIAAYHFLWRPAKALVAEFSKLQEIPKLNQQIRNTSTFTPPADRELTSGDVERFVRTQQSIQVKLGQRLDEFSAKYRLLTQATDHKPSASELLNAYKDLAGLVVDVKRAQVDALNQNDFSLEEYDWIRRSVYEASGIPINMDFEKILRAAAEGRKPDMEKREPTTPETIVPVPEKNRTLVAPYTKELADRAVLAAFGL
jgi:hypothetical protein